MLILASTMLAACAAPPAAPKELEDLTGYLFAHTADDDAAELDAGAANLDTWLDAHLDDTEFGYQVNDLDADAITALGSSTQVADGLVGAAVGHESAWPAARLGLQASVPPGTDTSTRGSRESGQIYQQDPACFASAACDWLEAEHWTTDTLALGIVADTHWWKQWRWLDLDAGRGLVLRQWLLEPASFNVDFLDVEAQYYLWIFLPSPDGTSRNVQTTWISASLAGAPVSDDIALSLVVDHMRGTADDYDATLAEQDGG